MTSQSTSTARIAGEMTGDRCETADVIRSDCESQPSRTFAFETANHHYSKRPKIFTSRDGRVVVDIITHIPINGVDYEEYHDYLHKRYRIEDIICDLANGNMPPGLVLRDQYGVMAYVARDRRHLERLVLA